MLIYTNSLDNIPPDKLKGFFVGWKNPPSVETHLQILNNSYKKILAIDNETNNVIGFITAISDATLSAYIPLLEVLPAYQGNGIGTELVRKMLAELKGLYMIDLICDKELQSFYKRFEMTPAHGMIIRVTQKP